MEELERYSGGEQPGSFEAEQQRLQELLKQNHMILFKTGLVQKMIEVQQRLFDEGKSILAPGELSDSKFWVTSGGHAATSAANPSREHIISRSRSFYITKADGEARRDQVACMVFYVSENEESEVQSLEICDGFDMRDAMLVYVLTQRLIEAKQAGEIPGLNSDLHTLTEKPRWDFTATENLTFFPVDESLLDLDAISGEFI